MTPELQIGHVVRCRGRRWLMTIESISSTGIIHCIWFDGEDVLHRENFDVTELELVNH